MCRTSSGERPASVAAVAFLVSIAFVAAGSDASADAMTSQGIAVGPHDHVAASLPDFDGDGTVGFGDFLLFAENFGLSHGDEGYDSRFDLNGDWEVGFSDFVIFSRNFGRDASTGKLQPWDLSKIVVIDSVRMAATGTPLFMRTEFANGELVDLEMKFIEVVDDFLPPMPVYMVEASDSVLVSLGGIARGMSGSPVFSAQGTWGAIAYGFSGQDNPPYYFFATPMEWVTGNKGTVPLAKRAATWGGSRIVPLDIPLASTGLNRVRIRPEGRPSVLSDAVSAGLTRRRQTSFAPGRPLAVGLLLGEQTYASFGTISFVDGNRVYGFGHAMSESGPVALPIIEAVVLGEISNLQAPFKFAMLNPTVRGTLTEDRLPGVRGILDDGPDLVSIRSVYAFPSGAAVDLIHAMSAAIRDPYLAIDLVVSAFFAPMSSRVEQDPDHGIRVTANVSFDHSDSTVARTRLFASPEGHLGALVWDASADVYGALADLMVRNDYALQVTGADVRVEVFAEPRFASVATVTADTVISPGDTLAVSAALRIGRRIDREVVFALAVPDTFSAGVYRLEAGSAATLADDGAGGGGSTPLFGFFGPLDGGGETLDDVFARVNRADENVLLKVRLAYDSPLEGNVDSIAVPDSGLVGVVTDVLGGDDPFPGPTAAVSTQRDVDLFVDGLASLTVKVVAPAGQ